MAQLTTSKVAGGVSIIALAAFGVSSGSSSISITAVPLTNAEILEESVANEAEHAIDRGKTALSVNPISQTTNEIILLSAWLKGKNATEQAIQLVSSQNADGRWRIGTNDVTRSAIERLRLLIGHHICK